MLCALVIDEALGTLVAQGGISKINARGFLHLKGPQYYFTEVGLICHLPCIRETEQITRVPLVGAIFENLVVMECAKALQSAMPTVRLTSAT